MDDAARYHRRRRWLGVASGVLGAGYLLGLLVTGASLVLTRAAATLVDAWPLQLVAVAVAVGAGHALITAPLAWWRGFRLPRHHGLLHQELGAWLADRAKAAALSAPPALALTLLIYALLRATPLWWLGAAAGVTAISVVLTALAPILILPRFYRLTPLGDEALRARLLALARRAGVPAVDVVVADQSRRSRTANAAVVGIGRTRRILLFDTLANGFEPDEVEAVLAHELGHHVHRDVLRGLGVQAALALATFAAADRLLRLGPGLWGYPDPADPAGLPWTALIVSALGLAALPLGHAFSRHVERQADDFALRLAGGPGAFVAAMERLARLNLAERRPGRLTEALFHSHPSIDRRIARALRT